jgi:hypothetical protein
MKAFRIENDLQQIDIDDFTSGIYFVRMDTAVKKIIIQK